MSYKHITINERCCIVEYLNLGYILSNELAMQKQRYNNAYKAARKRASSYGGGGGGGES